MPGRVPEVIFGYRILHYKNLPFILQNGVHCPESNIKDPNYLNIGNRDIIYKRQGKQIDVSPYGRIHDYVSFYFGPKSPMLYSIFKASSDTNFNQVDIVYIFTSIPSIEQSKLNYVFTTGQAIMELSTQHNNSADFDKIDWGVIGAKYWHDNPPEYVDRARKRMAELLVYKHVPLSCILGIGVYNEKMKSIIEEMLREKNLNLKVKAVPNWYY